MPLEAFHVTPVLVVPATVALNCCVPPDATVAEVGEMETETGGGSTTPPSSKIGFVAIPTDEPAIGTVAPVTSRYWVYPAGTVNVDAPAVFQTASAAMPLASV